MHHPKGQVQSLVHQIHKSVTQGNVQMDLGKAQTIFTQGPGKEAVGEPGWGGNPQNSGWFLHHLAQPVLGFFQLIEDFTTTFVIAGPRIVEGDLAAGAI